MRRTTMLLIVTAATACSGDPQPTQPTLAPNGTRRDASAASVQYDVVKLPTLGASPNRGAAINNGGIVAGFVTTNGQRHASLWRKEGLLDLGTLGGAHSSLPWPGLNSNGMVVGISQTSLADTLGEEWSCGAFLPSTGKQCLGFAWYDGAMHALPTLGGENGFATGVNARGQVVGWAETAIHDPTCNAPQKLQFRAVLWDPRKGTQRELPPLHGDSATAATAINGAGLVVGISGACDVAVGRFSARESVIWRDGVPQRLPNLGGEFWHTPMAISDRGDVVGFSNPVGITGGTFLPHGFLWTGGATVQDLRPLDGDDNAQAFSVNVHRTVVGVTCLGGACKAVVWQNGKRTLLKDLIDPTSPDNYLSARSINDAGQIAGNVLDAATGKVLPYVATPRGG